MRHPHPWPEVDSNDKKCLPTADLDGPVWSKEPGLDNQKYQHLHKIPIPATPPSLPNPVEMLPEPEQIDIDI